MYSRSPAHVMQAFACAGVCTSPLIDAARTKSVDAVLALMHVGYSLDWMDHAEHKTTLRYAAEILREPYTVQTLLLAASTYAQTLQEGNVFLDRQLMAAIHGAVLGKQNDLLSMISSMIPKSKQALYDRENFLATLELSGQHENIKTENDRDYCRELFHLARGQHLAAAITLCSKIINMQLKALPPEQAKQAEHNHIRAVISGASLIGGRRRLDFNPYDLPELSMVKVDKIDLHHFVRELSAELPPRLKKHILQIAIETAAENGHQDALTLMIEEYSNLDYSELLSVIAVAINIAAIQSRTDIILHLSIQAEKYGIKSEAINTMLAQAIDTAVISSHFALAKILKRIVADFTPHTNQMNEISTSPKSQGSAAFFNSKKQIQEDARGKFTVHGASSLLTTKKEFFSVIEEYSKLARLEMSIPPVIEFYNRIVEAADHNDLKMLMLESPLSKSNVGHCRILKKCKKIFETHMKIANEQVQRLNSY